jgi:hypothetical protein
MEEHPFADETATQTDLGCPECIGVLRVQRDGAGPCCYVCRIGHRFAPAMLLQGKEAVLERTLWSAVVLLEEIADTYQRLADDSAARPGDEIERRSARAREHARAIRRLIDETSLPAPEPP